MPQVRLKAEFQDSAVRKWGIDTLYDARDNFVKEAEPGQMTMDADVFVRLFQGLNTAEAVRHFKQFSERTSVRDMARSRSLKGSSLTIFTGMALLSGATPNEKLRFLFDLFDLGASAALWADECAIFLTCILRAFGTLADNTPELLKKTPEVLDNLVQEPFQKHNVMFLTWPIFRDWALRIIQDLVVDRERMKSSVSSSSSAKRLRREERSQKMRFSRERLAGKEERRKRNETSEESRVNQDRTRSWAPETEENRDEESSSPEVKSNQTEDEEDQLYGIGDSQDALEHGFSVTDDNVESLSDAAAWVPSPSSRPPHVDIVSFEDDSVQTIEPCDPEEMTRAQTEDGINDDVNERGAGIEGDDDFLDAEQAMEQILSCLPEIDAGELSSLPWLLNATKLLAEHDECATLGRIVPNILPLICNVAACEDPDLAMQAFQVLSAILDGAPEKVCECSDTVNERALLEMCLVRSTDMDALIGASASTCLYRIAEKQPYGFGRTLAALLEAGTLHDLPSVVMQCASTLEQLIDCMPGSEDITVDLEGRLGLLLSALCLWAHGQLEDCKHTAKIIVVKLGIRFGQEAEWDEAIANTDSVLLQAWNQGMDPTPEEEAEMEREHEQRKRREEMMSTMGATDDDLAAPERLAAERGWLVPAGKTPVRCNDEACMYPQVFAILGFRGKGGPTVGVPSQSTFDRSGTFRRREVIRESRTVEFMKVLWNGRVQVWEETEETIKETTHLEASNGEFAHREKVKHLRSEKVNGDAVKEDNSKRDYVHLKNTTGEFATYVDCASPKSPLIAATSPDWSAFGFGQHISSAGTQFLAALASPNEANDTAPSYIVHEPLSP